MWYPIFLGFSCVRVFGRNLPLAGNFNGQLSIGARMREQRARDVSIGRLALYDL